MIPFLPKSRIKAPSRVIRYFVLLGILVFAGYMLQWIAESWLAFIGPPLFLANTLQRLSPPLSSLMEISEDIRNYAFVLPLTMFYYGLVGFLFKQLLSERSRVGILSLLVFSVFIAYVHYTAWDYLTDYFVPYP